MVPMQEMLFDIRERNTERVKLKCLMCNVPFTTTRGSRICGRCHKTIDNRFYSGLEGKDSN
jgi:hypothetical protein